MSFKLLVNCPFPEDGTSIYRGWGPLGRLRSDMFRDHGVTVDLVAPSNKISWVDMMNIDGVFMQRPFLPYQVELIHLAKTYKKKVWIDYDDNLFCVPKDNPTHDNYNNPQIKENVKKISSMADVVTCSTHQLAKVIGEFNQNIHVVPNGIDLDLFNRVSDDIPRQPAVIWRGSHTHFKDIFKYTDQILEAYTKFPEWSWVFFGFNPTWVTEYMDEKRWRYAPFDSMYINYIRNLQRMRGAIHIVPLIDHEFNRCKSNVSHLEASLAGSVVLGPDWDEWKCGGMVNYKDNQDFGIKLKEMLSMPIESFTEKNNSDWQYIRDERSLTKVNKLRKGILMQMIGGF